MSVKDWRSEAAPTHRCKVCGATWRLWRKEETPGLDSDSWTLRSSAAGPCCDNVPMGEQIEPLTMAEVEKMIRARHAVEAMEQFARGPHPGDTVQ